MNLLQGTHLINTYHSEIYTNPPLDFIADADLNSINYVKGSAGKTTILDDIGFGEGGQTFNNALETPRNFKQYLW